MTSVLILIFFVAAVGFMLWYILKPLVTQKIYLEALSETTGRTAMDVLTYFRILGYADLTVTQVSDELLRLEQKGLVTSRPSEYETGTLTLFFRQHEDNAVPPPIQGDLTILSTLKMCGYL